MKVFYFGGNFGLKLRCIKTRNFTYAGFSPTQGLPTVLDADAQRCYKSDTRDYNSSIQWIPLQNRQHRLPTRNRLVSNPHPLLGVSKWYK